MVNLGSKHDFTYEPYKIYQIYGPLKTTFFLKVVTFTPNKNIHSLLSDKVHDSLKHFTKALRYIFFCSQSGASLLEVPRQNGRGYEVMCSLWVHNMTHRDTSGWKAYPKMWIISIGMNNYYLLNYF